MTSFTPFVITFIHAIAAASTEDVLLLNSIFEMLESMQDASPEMKRLHQICASFLHVAQRLVDSSAAPMETYDKQEDMLPISDDAAHLSIFNTEFLPELFGSDVFGSHGSNTFSWP